MRYRWPVLMACSLALTAQPAAAAKKPAHKPAGKAASKKAVVAEPVAPPKPGGFMVPKTVTLRPTTPAETEANAVWSVRAALNVAALQCQFSPFLATVRNYNDFLKQHGDELVRAQNTMVGHFRRYDGAKATNSFDQYTTRTYNSYSTLDAQYRFCTVAGQIGREVLTIPKDKLGAEAIRRSGEMRAALMEQPLSPALTVIDMAPIALAPIPAPAP